MSEFVAQLTLDALATAGLDAPAGYTRALRKAFASQPPPYGKQRFGDAYRRRSRRPDWFISLLVSDADMEGYSASRLWQYAPSVEDSTFREGLLVHAADEAAHSRLFGKLLTILFPAIAKADVRAAAPHMDPSLTKDVAAPIATQSFDETLSSAILINLFEIKALVLEELLRPTALAYAPSESASSVSRIVDKLVADELRHVHYSAAFIDRAIAGGYGSHVDAAMSDFQAALNHVTEAELGAR